MSNIKHYYLHVDLDAFFASVEQLDHPEYRGKPLIVGGKPEDKRSVVSTASYEARKYGVHSAMPTYKAYELCPNGIFIHGNMKRYSELSYQIMNIFRDFSPDVQQMSIDEAFIDITGTEKLFGPPEETAKKIKTRVKAETGLTVSVGLAPTKYLAKLASEINKPDGLYIINEGHEEEFMLNLPLKDVWGIGNKTYTNLVNRGLKTTRDIHEKSLEVLTFMYGQNMANFLYNVVRGIEVKTFDQKPKSHSISNETTFPYDLNNSYALETTILEICHSLIFRILKQNGFSRTVMVKIRYEDFSTVSIQKTYQSAILTLDSLYSCAKELFEQKYEAGRGVRLIGVGLENIENTERPYQQSLFEDNSEKKQKIEKSILTLEKKHPEIKIHKARLLEKLNNTTKIFFGFIFLLLLCANQKTFAQNKTSADTNDEQLLEYDIEGYWNAELTGNVKSTFGFGNPFTVGTTLPVVKQEVDLSALINITPKWYFSLEFLDEFEKNTYTFGYKNNKYLQEFKFSNREISFPDNYSSSLSDFSVQGGNNEAPGVNLHFNDYKNNKFQADFLFRYDMTDQKSATYYGKNLADDSTIQLQNFVYSNTFVFPSSESLSKIKNVYIQNDNGNFKDSKNRKYKKLNSSDYFILPNQNLLIISDNSEALSSDYPIPVIIVTFFNEQTVNQIIKETGKYSDETSFAGSIQKYFNSNNNYQINLEKYSTVQTETINGLNGLIIQNPKQFSPYLCANKYKITNKNDNLFLIDKYTQKESQKYKAEFSENQYKLTQNDLLNTEKYYAIVYNSESDSNSYLLPQVRYPLADTVPQIYLQLTNPDSLSLISRKYSPVKEFDIGKKASAGSVKVYINGIIDSGASYDQNTGFIKLSKNVSDFDKIYITYSEEGKSLNNGVFTAGIGFIYNILPTLSFDISFTGQYPFSPEQKYSTALVSKNGFSAFTTGINFNNNSFLINDILSVAIQEPNSTDIFLATVENKANDFISADKVTYNYYLDSQTGNFHTAIQVSTKDNYFINSSEFEIKLLPDSNLITQNADVYLQLGINNFNDIEYSENDINTWKISSFEDSKVLSPLNTSSAQWQDVKILISDSERAKFNNSKDFRILIVNHTHSITKDLSGNLAIGKYKVSTQDIFTDSKFDLYINSSKISDSGSNFSSKYAFDENSNSKIFWINTENNSNEIKAFSYFPQFDFSLYKTVNLDFAISEGFNIQYILLSSDSDEPALSIKLLNNILSQFASENIVYHTLSINLNENQVYIDKIKINKTDYELIVNKKIVPCMQKLIIYPENATQKESQFVLGKLYFTDSTSYSTVKNQFAGTFTFSEGKIEVKSTQSKSYFENQNQKGIDYIDSSISAEYSKLNITAKADADLHYAPKINTKDIFNTAGHQISSSKNLFSFIDLGEEYRFSPSNGNYQKKDYFNLDFNSMKIPLLLKSQFSDNKSQFYNTQNAQFSFKIDTPINNSKLIFNSQLSMNQKNTEKSKKQNLSYFETWCDISKKQFFDLESNVTRKIDFSTDLKLSIPKNNFSPYILYSVSGSTPSQNSKEYSDNANISLTIPFSTKSNAFEFRISQKCGENNILSNNCYEDDLLYLLKNQKNYSWFYSEIPFYSLFDFSLKDSIKNNQISSYYSTEYEATWKRTLFNNIKDLYTPIGANFAIYRDIKYTNPSINDTYQIKASVSENFINLFGKNSILHYYDWYEQEEYSGTLSAIFKIPQRAPKQTSFQITSKENLLYYLQDSNTLNFTTDFYIDNKIDWKFAATGAWNRNTTSSLLYLLTKLVYPSILNKEITSSVKESAGISFSTTNKIHKETYEYGRSAQISHRDNFSLNSSAKLLFGFEQKKCFNINLEYKIGIKLNY